MRSLQRAALSVAMTIAPMMASGCISVSAARSTPQPGIVRNDVMNSGRLAESRGDQINAKLYYEAALRHDPKNVECLHRLGVVCTNTREYPLAENYYRQAFAISPTDAELLADMGYLAYVRNDYEQAESFLEQSVRINGNVPRTINNLAIARAWRGKDESSLATFRIVNNEQESQRLLAAIQVARGHSGRFIPESPNREVAPLANVPNLPAQVTTYQSAATSVELPPPLPSEAPPELTGPSFALPTYTQSIDVTYARSAILSTPIELPAPSATDAPEPLADAQTSVVELTSATRFRGSFSDQFEISVQPVPATSNGLGRTQQLNVVAQTEIIPMPEELVAEPQQIPDAFVPPPLPLVDDDQSKQPAQRAKINSPSIWRKSRQARLGTSEANRNGTPEPVIRQISAVDDVQESKKTGHGICLVTLVDEQRLVPGDAFFDAEYHSRHYKFSSMEAMEKFQSDPDKYAPVAGGLDLVAAKNEQTALQGVYNFAIRFQGKLYLFASRENGQEFRRDPHKYISAD